MQLESEDYRVFFLNTYSGPARKIICAVSGTVIIMVIIFLEYNHNSTLISKFFNHIIIGI